MPGKDLKNKPLVEAILEVRWNLPSVAAMGMEGDPHYRLLLGRFSERVEPDYPFHEPLPAAQVPDGMVAHIPQHRFRVSEGKWPLIQVGPGVMTVNETDGYTWSDFKGRCETAVERLFASYPAKGDFKVQDLTLRYIDAVDVNFRQESVFEFLHEKMQTTISLPNSLFESGRVRKDPEAFNWKASFPHDDPGGLMTLRLAIGKHGDNPAVIWETVVEAARDRIPTEAAGFSEWLGKAHDLTDDWFFKLIEGELKGRFSGD